MIAISNFDKDDPKCKNCLIKNFCHGMKCGYMNFLNTGKINVPSDAECVFEHIIYNAMEQIIEFYLKQPVELLKRNLKYMLSILRKKIWYSVS